MRCSPIIILDAGCLDKEVIQLQCKGPKEAVYYQFSMANRIGDQTLLDVRATANADDVTIANITVDGQTFKCLISGGTVYHNVGLYFVATTSDGETRTFNAVLPIRPEGILNMPGDGTVVIMGTSGAQGIPGENATIEVGLTTTGDPGTDASVANSIDGTKTVLNFTIPRGNQGEVGKTPTIQIGETKTLPAGYDATVEVKTDDDGNVTLNFGIPSGTTGEAGQYILNIGTVDTLPSNEQATAEITSDGKGKHYLNLGIPQGIKGDSGISPTITIGTVETVEPTQDATVNISHGENGQDTINFNIPRGAPGKDGISYENNGKTALNVQSLQLADIQSINITDVADGQIFLNSKNNQLVIKQNNQWVSLNNMSNFEIETSYKINTGIFPINFAPSAFVASTDAVTGATGLTSGYVSPDTSKALPTPTTMLIRVDFKISSTDTTDADYYIVGYENALNIRINPNKKTVSAYSAQSKQYEMDYTALGINLHDDKFHTAYFILNNGYQGYTCYAIDGVYFNRGLSSVALYLVNLRVRGDANNTVPADVLIVKNIGISSSLPTLVDKQSVTTDFTSFEGYYTLLNNSLENKQLTNGILLKPYSVLDSLNTIIPFTLNNDVVKNQALFNEDGLYGGAAVITTLTKLDTFTFECYFKFNSLNDTDTTNRRSIIGNISVFSVGIPWGSSSKLTFKNYVNTTEITLVDDIVKDQWHTLAISCKNNIASIFVDGVKKASVPFDFSWGYIYLRGLEYNNYIAPENALVIKNISFIVGYAKYYNDYDSSLTPNSPNSDGFFYPLVNGLISNQNIKSPVVKIGMNENDSFNLWTVPNVGTPANYSNSIPIKHDYANQPDFQNTKFSRIFLKDISGNPVKGSV